MSDSARNDLGDDQKDVNRAGTNEPDASKQDALDDLLSARDEAVIAAFDMLRSAGQSVDQTVSRLIGDGLLPFTGAERFAFEHKDRPVRKKRKDGPGPAGNGKAGAELGGGKAASFTAAEAERLTTWIIEIAADLGYEAGKSIDIRIDGSWFILATTGSGGAAGNDAFDLIVHVHGDEAEDYAAEWLKSHPHEGPFFPVDDETASSGHDQRRKIEADELWNRGIPATGTITMTWLAGLGFNKEMLDAVAVDIAGLRIMNRRAGGPTLLAPVTDDGGNMAAVHIQPINQFVPATIAEPRNKSGRSGWVRDGMIRLGNHGEGAPTTLYLAASLVGALALRAVGLERVAAPPHRKWAGRATIPPDVTAVVLVGDGSEAMQAAVPRLLGQGGIKVKRARLKAWDKDGILDSEAIKTVAKAADGAIWQRGEDEFFRELYRLDDISYGRAKLSLRKIDGMPSLEELSRSRKAARKEAVAEKKAAAEAEQSLSLRVGESPPAPEPQNLPELLDDIVALLERYVVMPPTAAWVLALFAVYTSVFEEFNFAMRIWLYSVEPESGKTTLAMLTLRCCPRRKRSDNITEATFHRFIGAHPDYTIFINEANAPIADGGILVDLICSGFEKGSSVDRTEKDEKGKFTPSASSPFCPLILAGLEEAAKAVQTRCLLITMEPPASVPGQPAVRTPRVTRKAEERAEKLARRVARWAKDNRPAVVKVVEHVDEMEETDHTVHNGVHPLWLSARELDRLLPLFVIASLAGGEWPARIEQAARRLSPKGKGTLVYTTELLLDCLSIIHAKRERTVPDGGITPEELHSALLQDDNGTWREFVDPKRQMSAPQPLTVTRLGKMLGAYRVIRKAETTTGHKRRLYPLGQFLDAFRKYLVPGRIPEDTAAEVASKIAEIDVISSRHGFSANKPGNPVRSLGNEGVEPNPKPVRQTRSGPGLKTRKPLRRKASDRVTGFETEKPGTDEMKREKAPKKRTKAGNGVKPQPPREKSEVPPPGEDI
jgi:hypothetical protein